jgi:hypothetical protein
MSTIAELNQQKSQVLTDEMWKQLKTLAMLGFGLGAGARGVQGLYNTTRRNLQPPRRSVYAPLTLDIPARPEKKERDAKLAHKLAHKQANPAAPAAPATPTQPSLFDYIKSLWPQHNTPQGHPLALPLGLATGAGSLYGGYKLTDWLLDKRRRQELEGELIQAQREYENALASQYKSSALAEDLDKLCDLLDERWQKQAADAPAPSPSIAQPGTGDYANVLAFGVPLTLAGLAALGSGSLAYDIVSKRRKAKLLEEARKKQLRRSRLMQAPPLEIHVGAS